ncbi:MAG: tetratricopeptide repeat protein, partial [Deltaproteobacteria bacterium]
LARLYRLEGNWERLIEINERETKLTNDNHQIISLQIKNAEIYEEKLGKADQAIICYQKVLQQSPSHLLAIRALERLYLRQENWESLIAMYKREIEITESPEHLASLHFRVGRLWERLGKTDEAILSYRRILDLEPSSSEAFGSLETLLRQGENWKGLINVYQTRLEASRSRAESISIYCELGWLWERKFGQINKSIASYEKALQLDHSSNGRPLKSLRRLCRQWKKWEKLIQVLHREAELSKDPSRSAKLYYEIGQLLEKNLADKDRALESYRRALEINSAYQSSVPSDLSDKSEERKVSNYG